ncbi:MAG: hypothetical protein LBB80_06310 [Treponema sp.]|nr:hypothetical protein [Treponema sp.]
MVKELVENTKPKEGADTEYFPDEHFRLGFDDFPISYPIIFDEFLFSREMFEEYFSKETINSFRDALSKRNKKLINEIISPIITNISQKKALHEDFVVHRSINFLIFDYIKFLFNKK